MFAFLLLVVVSTAGAKEETSCFEKDELDCRIDGALKDTSRRELHKLYQDYKTKHDIVHGDVETPQRVQLFKKFLKEVQDLRNRNVPWKVGITFFAHMTECEKEMMQGVNATELLNDEHDEEYRMMSEPPEMLSTPLEYDWRQRKAVTGIHNQIGGTCWAHAAVVPLEAQLKLLSGRLKELSSQELIDCTHESRKMQGKKGGMPFQGWMYIKDTSHRLGLRSDIPDREGIQSCNYEEATNALRKYRIGTVRYPSNSEHAAVNAIAKDSPVTVVVNMKGSALMSYKGGPYDWRESSCSAGQQHAMVMVAYDEKFFFIKNSWRVSWGNEGYLWWLRGIPGHNCDLLKFMSFPVLERVPKEKS